MLISPVLSKMATAGRFSQGGTSSFREERMADGQETSSSSANDMMGRQESLKKHFASPSDRWVMEDVGEVLITAAATIDGNMATIVKGGHILPRRDWEREGYPWKALSAKERYAEVSRIPGRHFYLHMSCLGY